MDLHKPKIVLLAGFALHGKTTSASFMSGYLRQFNFKCFNIAYGDYLKFVAKKYYGWDGNKDQKGRELLQKLGTEIARDTHPDIWVNVVIENVKAFGKNFDYVIVDDFRYPNEHDRWIDEGYHDVFTIWTHRQQFDNGLTKEQKLHRSETSLLDFTFDRIISVPTDLNALSDHVIRIAKDWLYP